MAAASFLVVAPRVVGADVLCRVTVVTDDAAVVAAAAQRWATIPSRATVRVGLAVAGQARVAAEPILVVALTRTAGGARRVGETGVVVAERAPPVDLTTAVLLRRTVCIAGALARAVGADPRDVARRSLAITAHGNRTMHLRNGQVVLTGSEREQWEEH
jgi:hypothetical protein